MSRECRMLLCSAINLAIACGEVHIGMYAVATFSFGLFVFGVVTAGLAAVQAYAVPPETKEK